MDHGGIKRPSNGESIMMNFQKYQAPGRRSSRRVMWGLLALMLIAAAVSYGFVWRAEVRQEEEYRSIIYNITKAMGETEGCYD